MIHNTESEIKNLRLQECALKKVLKRSFCKLVVSLETYMKQSRGFQILGFFNNFLDEFLEKSA